MMYGLTTVPTPNWFLPSSNLGYWNCILSLSLSLSHTHTHSLTLYHYVAQTHTFPPLSLSHTHTHTLSHFSSLHLSHTLSSYSLLTLSHTHTLSFPLSIPPPLTLSHTLTFPPVSLTRTLSLSTSLPLSHFTHSLGAFGRYSQFDVCALGKKELG